jgi:hypothetical protein
MANKFSSFEERNLSLWNRWGIIDWDRYFPWWFPPVKLRILLHADGSVDCDGGTFLGLQ